MAMEWSARTRPHILERLARELVDVLVIGGGITGAGVAREAALQGWRVALVERSDFAAGTSSRSSKLIHGGLRYLAQGDISLVREAARERAVLRRLAPHLAEPMQMLVPVYSRTGYLKIRAGLYTYDRLAKVNREERNRMLSREEVLATEPLLRADRLYGGGLYYEYLTDDARLVIETVKSAVALGALAVNNAPVVRLHLEHGRVGGAFVQERTTGSELLVRARAVINAAGPWVDDIRLMQNGGAERRLHLTKGIHLTLHRERLPVGRCVVMNAADRRSVFVIPHGDLVYLGTTDTDYDGPREEPQISVADAEYLLAAANAAFTIEPLQLRDVAGAWAGLRPLLHEEGRKPSEISRQDEIMIGPTGLISIAGGKLTTFRCMAQRILETAASHIRPEGRPIAPRHGTSDSTPLCGGDFGSGSEAGAEVELRKFHDRLRRQYPQVGHAQVDRLVRLYGTNAEKILAALSTDSALAEEADDQSALTRAEVEYNLREEMALTLTDVLERRTRLFLWDRARGLKAAPRVASWMAQWLCWTPARQQAEIEAYRHHVHEVLSFTTGDTTPQMREAHAREADATSGS